jgi:hypothetical protein
MGLCRGSCTGLRVHVAGCLMRRIIATQRRGRGSSWQKRSPCVSLVSWTHVWLRCPALCQVILSPIGATDRMPHHRVSREQPSPRFRDVDQLDGSIGECVASKGHPPATARVAGAVSDVCHGGSPNGQETSALPSSSCPQNSKTPPRPFQPHPSIAAAVPSWNMFEETQQRTSWSACFAKKRGRRQGADASRLLHMSRMQVQVRHRFHRTVE